ncbi:MAG TPA: DUF2225 domain-containing protein [Clostridiales bacterium]|nr:DUF2225 domain-containing protein [Clostridiales bacterium]
MINLNSLLKMTGVKKYAPGMVIAREGDSSTTEMYIILHGNAGIYKNYQMPGEVMTGTLTAGDFFGEMTLFAGKTRAETVVAITELIAIGINRQNIGELFSNQPELTFSLMEKICKRYDALFQEHQKLLLDTGKLSQDAASSAASPLFPKEHGSYTLALNNQSDCLYLDTVTCPLCGSSFKHLSVIATKLRRESTDPDMRVRYKDIEPLHYEIVTCPSCLFSAQSESFPTVSKGLWSAVFQAVSPYSGEKYKLKTGDQRDTFTVFAGYYLALLCAPHCFDEHQVITGSLWQKLSRIYQDCGDQTMVRYAWQNALKEFLYAYEHYTFNERKDEQISFIIGDLYQKLGDLDQARSFFFQVKSNRAGSPLMRRQADLRLEQIREMRQGREN